MKKEVKKKISKNTCSFLNSIAHATKESYSFVGLHEPKKPVALLKKSNVHN